MGQSATSDRYTVHKVNDHPWGGTRWAIWDNELETWADSLGRYLTKLAADAAASKASGGVDA